MLLFVFGLQVFDDSISDLAFLELDPFTPIFFLTSAIHCVKTTVRDLDLWVNAALQLRRLAVRGLRRLCLSSDSGGQPADDELLLAADRSALYAWHYQYDRFFLRHQHFLSEMSCKLVVFCLLAADLLLAASDPSSSGSWQTTITSGLRQQQRVMLMLEILYLTVLAVLTHCLVLALLRLMEDREDRRRQQQVGPVAQLTDLSGRQPRDVSDCQVEDGGPVIAVSRAAVSGFSAAETFSLRWICYDAWRSREVVWLLVIGVSRFNIVACTFAFLAAIGWRSQLNND